MESRSSDRCLARRVEWRDWGGVGALGLASPPSLEARAARGDAIRATGGERAPVHCAGRGLMEPEPRDWGMAM